MLLPLVGVALAGIPPNWLAWPVAAELHPVGWHYGVRYQEILEETMGGRRASPAFSPIVAQADVYWRLVAADGRGSAFDGDATPWRDAALAGTLLATSRLVDETVGRAPTVDAFFTAADLVVNPSLHLVRDRDGDLRAVHRPGGALDQRVRSAEDEIAAPQVRRTPSVDLGFDWHLRDEDDPPRAPFLDYGAFVSLREVGLSNLRVEVLVLAAQWSVTGRQRIYPRVYVLGTARSVESTTSPWGPGADDWTTRAQPGRWSTGMLWSLPWGAGWNLRAERIVTLADASVTWQLSVRAELGAFAPGRVSPALGARDPDDAWLPAPPPRDGLPLRSVVATPALPPATPSGASEARRSPGRR